MFSWSTRCCLVGGHHGGSTRLIAVEMMFSHSLWYIFLCGKSGNLWMFLTRLFPEMQASISGFLSLLKNQNRVLKCLVSVLEKSFSISFCSWVRALFIQSGPFSLSLGNFFIQLGPFFIQAGPFFNSVRPFFDPDQVFLCWMGPFFKQKGPLTPNAWPGYKMFGLETTFPVWAPLSNRGAPFLSVNFCFIDLSL